MREVISPIGDLLDTSKEAFVEKGTLINSGNFDGMDFDQAFKAISKALSKLALENKKLTIDYVIGASQDSAIGVVQFQLLIVKTADLFLSI